jgi:DNA-directed RNA polymerase specialized sigma24 family protein
MTPEAAPPTDLIARLRRKEPAALRELSRRFERQVVRFVARLRRGDEEEAKHIAEEVFVRAFHSADDFRGKTEGQLRVWIYRLAVAAATKGGRGAV